MKAVIQRVRNAHVSVNGERCGAIDTGLLVLLGVAIPDTTEDAEWLCRKIQSLRIFPDEAGLMNRSVTEADGDILVISQFTLQASYKKGNRPSFIAAARPEQAIPLYEHFVSFLSSLTGKTVQTGIFAADMQVSLVNDGPVTIVMDTHNKE
jgi:D-aminoacyl-tRNA deacylase